MHSYFYSAKTNGFYLFSLRDVYENSPNGWPKDAVPIDEGFYQFLLEGQSENKTITSDGKGHPILIDTP